METKTRGTAAAARPDFLAALAGAGQEDLDQVGARIEALNQELASLKAAQKILGAKLNGTPAAASGQTLSEEERERVLNQIYDYIDATGPSTSAAIAAAIGGTSARIGQLCKSSEWFEKVGLKWQKAMKNP